MSNSVLAAQVRARTWLDSVKSRIAESEAGQGAAEYAGVIVIAALLIGAILTALDDGSFLGNAVKAKIDEIISH